MRIVEITCIKLSLSLSLSLSLVLHRLDSHEEPIMIMTIFVLPMWWILYL
jgi:hypothetical protein